MYKVEDTGVFQSTPEKRLHAAILRRALEDLHGAPEHRDAAIRWLLSDMPPCKDCITYSQVQEVLEFGHGVTEKIRKVVVDRLVA